jgi:serine/threonine protein kinase
VERLGGELRYARKLQHPNVCRVFEMAETDGVHFLTMEFAEGGSLRRRLAAKPDRPLEECIADARAVIDGLAAIHGANVIHRDIKPENVLVMQDGRLVITDLGLAVTLGQATFFSSQIAGTPSYMAPEVVIGDKATLAADVWSLGVLLHEIMFARRPEWSVSKHGRTIKPPVNREAPRLLRGMAALCADCLQELPPRRLPDAGAVKRRFEDIVAGRLRLWRRPGRARSLAVAGLITIVLAGAGFFSIARRLNAPKVGRPQVPELAITGRARDLSTSQVLLSGQRPIICLDPLPDGRRLRALLGIPTEPVEIDIGTGARSPSPLRPETFITGCPRLSPDGQSLLFTKKDRTGPTQIMFSPHADGSDARVMNQGSDPHWLPSGREFIFTFDPRHLATMRVNGGLMLFPEAPADHRFFGSAAATEGGHSVIATFDDGRSGSFIDTFDYPSLTLTRTVHVPGVVRSVGPGQGPSDLLLSITDPGDSVLAALRSDSLMRLGAVPGTNVMMSLATNAGTAFTTYVVKTSLFLKRNHEPEEQVLRDEVAHGYTVSAYGDVLVGRRLRDGRWVIAHVSKRGITPLTTGPVDMYGEFVPGRREFVYSDGIRKSIVACTLDPETSSAVGCRSVHAESTAPVAPVPSPDGARVAYLVNTGEFIHVRVASMRGGLERDLGTFQSDCPIRWSSARAIWTYRAADGRGADMDIFDGKTTELRRPTGDASKGPTCRPPSALDSTQPWLRAERRTEATLWRAPDPG